MRRNASVRSRRGRRLAGHEGRDHLGVGGDRGGERAARTRALQVGVVVDVAVERGDHVRPAGRCRPPRWLSGWVLGSEMMPTLAQRVWPSTESLAPRRRQGQAQQAVAADRGAQGGGVVAELADLGRRLVDERQDAVGHPDRAGREQRVVAAAGQPAGQLGIVEVEPVVPHEQVQPGRVPPPHLQAVDGRQRQLDRQEAGQRGRAGLPPGQRRRRRPRCAGGPGATAQSTSLARTSAALVRSTSRRVGVGRPRPGPRSPATNASSWSSRASMAATSDGRSASARTPGTPRSRRVGHGEPRRPCRSSAEPRASPTSVDACDGGVQRCRAAPRRWAWDASRGRGQDGDDPAHGRRGYRLVPAWSARAAARSRATSSWPRVGLVVAGRLDHHPHERLGAARPHQHPPGRPELGLGRRHLGRQRRRGGRRADPATRTLTSTWGSRVIAAAASSASVRPDRWHDVEQQRGR